MKNLKKWFTLVELIVVITILAILGTIAFISLQGYSADARNSKRVSDLGSIGSAISVKLTQWVGILAFFNSQVNSSLNNSLTGASIWGTWVTTSEYSAGPVNYVAVGIKKDDFVDPNGTDYVGWATTKINGKYQLAAKMEQGGWAFVAKIFGDYAPRTSTGWVNSVTVTSTWSNNAAFITAADIGKIREGDTVTGGRTVAKVSADGLQLTLSSPLTATGAAALALNAAETAGLIDATGTATGPVTDAGTVLPY
jgi:prepilin-type N-terminal cleavage/methylation domain-containing protein